MKIQRKALLAQFSLHHGLEESEAVDHHGCLGKDADDDADDIAGSGAKTIGNEVPDCVDADGNVEKDADDKTRIVLLENDGHHDMGQSIEGREVGSPEAPFDSKEVRHESGNGQGYIDQWNIDPE